MSIAGRQPVPHPYDNGTLECIAIRHPSYPHVPRPSLPERLPSTVLRARGLCPALRWLKRKLLMQWMLLLSRTITAQLAWRGSVPGRIGSPPCSIGSLPQASWKMYSGNGTSAPLELGVADGLDPYRELPFTSRLVHWHLYRPHPAKTIQFRPSAISRSFASDRDRLVHGMAKLAAGPAPGHRLP